jgi:hypothetical protein
MTVKSGQNSSKHLSSTSTHFCSDVMAKLKGLELSSVGDLDNEQRLRILGIIDKLRELGVGENVSLPQVGTPCSNLNP